MRFDAVGECCVHFRQTVARTVFAYCAHSSKCRHTERFLSRVRHLLVQNQFHFVHMHIDSNENCPRSATKNELVNLFTIWHDFMEYAIQSVC